MARNACSFNPSGGAIADLEISGCITGVTYDSVGPYTVSLSGAPENYIPLLTGTFPSVGAWSVLVVAPASGVSASAFTITSNTLNGPYDPASVSIYIP